MKFTHVRDSINCSEFVNILIETSMTVTNCAFNPVIIVSNNIYWSQKASITVDEDDMNQFVIYTQSN